MADEFVENLIEAPYLADVNNVEKKTSDKKNSRRSSSKTKNDKDSYKSENLKDRSRSRSKDKKKKDKSKDIKHKSRSRSPKNKKKKSTRSSSKEDKKSKKSHKSLSRSSSRHKHHSNKTKKSSHKRSRSRSKHRHSSRHKKSKSKSRSASLHNHLDDGRGRKSHETSVAADPRDRYIKRYNEEYERRNASRKASDTPPPRACDKDNVELTPEERDQRTVLFMQLGPYVNERDIMDFMKSVGKKTKDVRDIRLIVDSRTRRSKGLAYVEFKEPESVQFALTLNGQKIRGRPIVVQHSQAEKNRLALLANGGGGLQKGQPGPMKLYVGSLHPNITEEMLRGIFEPFGKIDFINLIMDLESNKSRGYGFIQFHDCEDAKRGLESLNGFELAGKPMKVSKFNERLGISGLDSSPENYSSETFFANQPFSITPESLAALPINYALKSALGNLSQSHSAYSILDNESVEKTGISMGATGRLALMAKLAEGTGMQLPKATASALNAVHLTHPAINNPLPPAATQAITPSIVTPCFMLSNMFDPAKESGDNWHLDIQDDVIDECDKFGGILHLYVDKNSPNGNVYIKCASVATAISSVNTLHGRFFAGKMITAAYIPLANYHSLFPDSISAIVKLKSSSTLA